MADIKTITLPDNQTYNLRDSNCKPISSTTVTIAVNDWSNKTCTKNVTGVTSDNIVVVTFAPTSKSVYTTADVYCSAQGSGTLTFTCATTPTDSVTANVMIVG